MKYVSSAKCSPFGHGAFMSIQRAVPVVGPSHACLHADRYDAAGAGRESVAAPLEDQHGVARDDEEALLERLHVQVDAPASIELGQAPARVDGADRAVGEGKTPVTRGVLGERRLRLDVGGAEEVMHRGLQSGKKCLAVHCRLSTKDAPGCRDTRCC